LVGKGCLVDQRRRIRVTSRALAWSWRSGPSNHGGAGPSWLRDSYRLLHVATRLAFSGRRGKLLLPAAWPWTAALKAAFDKLKTLPAAAD
jgi:hypothetical protein